MIEQIIYKNHMNEEVRFGEKGIFANENDLRDFTWDVVSKNGRISGFNKGIAKKAIPLIVKCNSEEEGLRLKNKIFEIPEKDVLAQSYGELIIGDYRLKCFITGSKKTSYLNDKRELHTSIEVTTDLPSWIKEVTTTFGYGQGTEGNNLDFNNDYPMDYTSNLLGKELNNTNFVDTNFRMVIYGPCTNPEVIVAGHSYQVEKDLVENEYMTIDSVEKTIVLTHQDGSKENCFNRRKRESYIFQKLPPGISGVSSGHFKFDITLLEERSEPKWI